MNTNPVFGQIATWVGRLNGLPPWSVAGVSGLPMVSRSAPSGVNLRTVWWRSSVSHTVSSASIVMAWARRTCPSPHERRKRPSRSKTITGCSPREKQNTLSLLSTATPATSTKRHFSGSAPQPTTGSNLIAVLLSPRSGAPRWSPGLLDALGHALEAPAQRRQPFLVRDDVQPVGVDRAQHAVRHVGRLEIAADQIHLAATVRGARVAQTVGAVARALADRRLDPHRAQDGDADAVAAQ